MKKIGSILLICVTLFGCSKEDDSQIQQFETVYTNLDPNLFGIWKTTYNDSNGQSIDFYFSFSENGRFGLWSEEYTSSVGIGTTITSDHWNYFWWVEGGYLFLGYNSNTSTIYPYLEVNNEYSVVGETLLINGEYWVKQ